jgi:2-phosphoglycerate kinase
MNTKLTTATILVRGELEGVTAYQIAVMINEKLQAAGVDKIRPQMIYNYSKNGMIVSGIKNDMSHRYSVTEATEFAERFATKRISKNVPEVTTPKDTAELQSSTRG